MMDTLALLQNDSRDLWEENRALVRRLSRMEAYAVQRREAMRRFVDLVNDGHFDGGAAPMKEYAMFRLFERDVERWEEWDAKHPFLGEEGA